MRVCSSHEALARSRTGRRLQGQKLRVPGPRSQFLGHGHERVEVLEELLGRTPSYGIDPVGQDGGVPCRKQFLKCSLVFFGVLPLYGRDRIRLDYHSRVARKELSG
jgi:hypothetical protein